MDDAGHAHPEPGRPAAGDAALDDIRTRLVGLESRVDSVDRHVVAASEEQRGALAFLRQRAGWILLWSVLGLGSCGYQNGARDVDTRLGEISSKLDAVSQPGAGTATVPATHDEVMELCHLVGQVAGREKVAPKAVSDETATDCVGEAKAGYDSVVR